MGISLAWISVKGKIKDTVLQQLQLVATGEEGEFFRFPIAGKAQNDGALIITAMRCDHYIIQEKTLDILSEECTIIACSVEEHVNYSSVALWRNGTKNWSVEHRGDFSPGHLTVIGTPEGLDAIRHTLPKGEPEVDYYFDIPLLIARQLTGFKHDENQLGTDREFQELRPVSPVGAQPWWKFWRSTPFQAGATRRSACPR